MGDSPDQGGVDIDGSGIDMFPAPTSTMVGHVEQAATDSKSGWQAVYGRITALDSKLGNGPLGRPVAKQYNPAVKQIADTVDLMHKRVEKLAEAGVKAVPLYVNTDMRSGQNFEF